MQLTSNELPTAVAMLLSKVDQLEKHILTFLAGSTPSQESYINIKEAAAFLDISPNTIYGLTSRREIPFYKKGKGLRFLKSELIEWVKASRKRTASEIKAEAGKGVSRG